MMMKKILLILIILSIFSIPGFATQLYVNKTDVSFGKYVNTGTNLTMLNLTFNLTGVNNITIYQITVALNTTSGKNANETNLTVCAYETDLSNLLGCSGNWTNNQTNISFSTNMTVNNTNISNMLIVAHLNTTVYTPLNFSLYIPANTSIERNDTSVLVNGTFPISSEFTEVHDLHATAYVSPHYVDTNVVNQTIKLILNSTGRDNITFVEIKIPSVLPSEKVNGTIIETSGDFNTLHENDCTPTGNTCNYNSTTNIIRINISASDTIPDIKGLTLYILSNTSSSPSNSTFTVNISNQYLNTTATEASSGALNVTTKQLLQVTKQGIMKNSAVVNGTDYWLFNITFNLTAPVNGTLQFKMDNWTIPSNENISMLLVNSSEDYYAWIGTNLTTLRAQQPANSTNATDRTYITNDYGEATHGLSISNLSSFIVYVKMIIPTNAPCCYPNWYTQFWALFRVLP